MFNTNLHLWVPPEGVVFVGKYINDCINDNYIIVF